MECANTKKNRSFLANWSDDESEDYKGDEEQESKTIALAAVISIPKPDTNHQKVLEDVAIKV